jgi:arginyl-tRNA synthetase
MKTRLTQLLQEVLQEVFKDAQGRAVMDAIPLPVLVPVLEVPSQPEHGDFATTLPMTLARTLKRPPKEIASQLKALLQQHPSYADLIQAIEIAGPGYLNFFIRPACWLQTLLSVHRQKADYGRSEVGAGRSVLIEFVSANPTGPLHVAHGRAAALGDALARLLLAVGYKVEREYYINDVGNQVNLLGQSTALRYRELFGASVTLPTEGYHGAYIIEIARALKEVHGDHLLDKPDTDPVFIEWSLQTTLGWIRRDMDTFGIQFDRWFSEKGLFSDVSGANVACGACEANGINQIDLVLAQLKTGGHLYEKEGAVWLSTTTQGDDKDRVVIRNTGERTYFTSDIAYHRNKFQRGHDRLINIWGADHHGYVARVKAAAALLGDDPDRLTLLIHQLVNLLRDGKQVAMSKRTGEFVTLQEVMEEVGVDATRFFFLMRRTESPLDFDLELAKKHSDENPVFYVQYAHARICSILRVAAERGVQMEAVSEEGLSCLTNLEEQMLIKHLTFYPDLLQSAAEALAPHRLTVYLQELAGLLHRYYFAHRVVTDDAALTQARLLLVTAVKIVLQNGLQLLGIRAPEQM